MVTRMKLLSMLLLLDPIVPHPTSTISTRVNQFPLLERDIQLIHQHRLSSSSSSSSTSASSSSISTSSPDNSTCLLTLAPSGENCIWMQHHSCEEVETGRKVAVYDAGCHQDGTTSSCQITERIKQVIHEVKICQTAMDEECEGSCPECDILCQANNQTWCEITYVVNTSQEDGEQCEDVGDDPSTCMMVNVRRFIQNVEPRKTCYDKEVGQKCTKTNCRLNNPTQDCEVSKRAVDIKLTHKVCSLCTPRFIPETEESCRRIDTRECGNETLEIPWAKYCYNEEVFLENEDADQSIDKQQQNQVLRSYIELLEVGSDFNGGDSSLKPVLQSDDQNEEASQEKDEFIPLFYLLTRDPETPKSWKTLNKAPRRSPIYFDQRRLFNSEFQIDELEDDAFNELEDGAFNELEDGAFNELEDDAFNESKDDIPNELTNDTSTEDDKSNEIILLNEFSTTIPTKPFEDIPITPGPSTDKIEMTTTEIRTTSKKSTIILTTTERTKSPEDFLKLCFFNGTFCNFVNEVNTIKPTLTEPSILPNDPVRRLDHNIQNKIAQRIRECLFDRICSDSDRTTTTTSVTPAPTSTTTRTPKSSYGNDIQAAITTGFSDTQRIRNCLFHSICGFETDPALNS